MEECVSGFYQYVVSYQVIVLGKCSTTGGRAPGTTDCWGSLLEKQLCMKGPGSPGWHQPEHEPATWPGTKEGICPSGLYEECCQQLEGADLAHLFSTGQVTTGFLSLVLSFPAQKRHGHVGKSLWRAMKGIKGLVYLMEGKTARAVTIEPGEWGRLRENNFRNMWRGSASRVEPGSFQWEPSDRTRGKEHKEKRKIYSLDSNHFYTVRVTEHWHRLPRMVVEFPSLKILISHLHMVLGNWLQVVLLEQQVDQNSRSCLQSRPFCDCDLVRQCKVAGQIKKHTLIKNIVRP